MLVRTSKCPRSVINRFMCIESSFTRSGTMCRARTLMMPENLSAASTAKGQDTIHEILGHCQPLGRSQAEHPEDQGVVVLTGSRRPGLGRCGGGIVLKRRGSGFAGLAHRVPW